MALEMSGVGYGIRTHRLVFLQTLVMSPAQLRPLCELVLRAGAVHFALQLDDFDLHALLFACVAGCRCGQL